MSAAELLLEYPPTYEYRAGDDIHPDLAGMRVPVPPPWVRARVSVPDRCEFATLGKEVEDFYPRAVRDACVAFVKDWAGPVRKYGAHLVVAGRGTYLKRSWAAAAVIHEIVMRFGATSDISAGWVGSGAILHALAQKGAKGDDTYNAIRSRLMQTKLLLVEDPMRLAGNSDARWLLEGVYDHRDAKKMPTITTLATDLADRDWGALKPYLGYHIPEVLETNAYDYIANF